MDIEKIEEKWSTYNSLLSKLKDENINKMLEALSERIILSPGSPKTDQYGCEPGGLISHALEVTDAMRKISKAVGSDIPTASIVKVGLLHEIGKVGSETEDYFINQDSSWHREKLGQHYKYNENLEKMTVSHRTLWLLQNYNVKLDRDEWEAIATAQGNHLEENKFYGYTKNSMTKLLHAAKSMTIK